MKEEIKEKKGKCQCCFKMRKVSELKPRSWAFPYTGKRICGDCRWIAESNFKIPLVKN